VGGWEGGREGQRIHRIVTSPWEGFACVHALSFCLPPVRAVPIPERNLERL
jgi:hypothetical protein